ncbi:MAG: endonuclease III domain-containing protein [Sedimenticola sp.]|nr:endonuclease III domain-containing protein [Sedimenticola sp.]
MSPAQTLPCLDFGRVYRHLLEEYGPQGWWPADSPFEVMIGAVLTQNTAWRNVESAIRNLLQADLLSAEAILATPDDTLADLLRPSGYFNVKARRLKNLCRYISKTGYRETFDIPTGELRQALLGINGIGPETADDILLYAYERPVFVIDAYTRRFFSRLGLVSGNEGYEILRNRFETSLDATAAIYNEYHALIVWHGKEFCRSKPLCEGCTLRTTCGYAKK